MNIHITLGFTFVSLFNSFITMPFYVFFVLLCFPSFRFGYMKQPGRVSLAQSHVCARGFVMLRRSDAKSPPRLFAGITARLLQIRQGETKTGKDKQPSSVTVLSAPSCVTFFFVGFFSFRCCFSACPN